LIRIEQFTDESHGIIVPPNKKNPIAMDQNRPNFSRNPAVLGRVLLPSPLIAKTHRQTLRCFGRLWPKGLKMANSQPANSFGHYSFGLHSFARSFDQAARRLNPPSPIFGQTRPKGRS
jgi:hypothetical protein